MAERIAFNTVQPLFLVRLTLVLCTIVLQCCDSNSSPNAINPADELNAISINSDGSGFVDSEGNPFRPWGFNYTGTVEFPLLEDEWSNEESWTVFEVDLRTMYTYRANTVRLHLQLHHYMDGMDSVRQDNLMRLQRLVSLAAEHGLYTDITGLAAYRASDQPAWYTNLSETDRWQTHANFWTAIAQQLKDQNSVLTYNLMNEPVAVDVPDGNWLPGDSFGGFHFVQSITLDTAGREPSNILRSWMQKMRDAIQSVDPTTPITVGFLPLGNYGQYADVLDYLSPHYYPKQDEEQLSIDHLTNNRAGVPIVVEEIFPLATGIGETVEFIISTEPIVAGYLSHYDGQTIEELTAQNTIPAAIRAAWLERFTELAEQYSLPVR